jgi:polyhydroxyalkanoate synthesis repressor PhaR
MLPCGEMVEFDHMTKSEAPVTIKQYAGQRLYRPGEGTYVTLGDLAAMVEDEEDFVVYDAKTGTDITSSVLKQIIVERAHHG